MRTDPARQSVLKGLKRGEKSTSVSTSQDVKSIFPESKFFFEFIQ